MRKAVRVKFLQHEDIREVLLGTGSATIVEHTTNDRFWGDGSGQNWLGRILMEVREDSPRSKPARSHSALSTGEVLRQPVQ
jgi:ribA/ribD-fused uncharacterized protein